MYMISYMISYYMNSYVPYDVMSTFHMKNILKSYMKPCHMNRISYVWGMISYLIASPIQPSSNAARSRFKITLNATWFKSNAGP